MFYETPQFIKQEIKLMGVITFNQLWLLIGFFGFLAILFFTLNHILWIILALFLAPLGIILTFGHMNGQPMYKIFPAAIRHFWLPKHYLWQKEKMVPIASQKPSTTNEPTIVTKQPPKKLDQQVLNSLSQFLDQ
ncbi:MAG: PrgI family protein [Parcubacteria group bacterium]|nr:PrgI family protein [Parcubacteria group bacterium]